MSEKLIKPYEISVWEDKLIQDGNGYKFIENKIAIIGSDTMVGMNKVYDPVLNKKINGEKTLTFSLKYKYLDPYSENEEVINPFVSFLVNERKIKLHYDGEWYEFVIREHEESSDGYEWTYSCEDAFVLELSKTGYNIEFDAELNNNQGTAEQLARKTLKDTEWQIGKGDNLRQLIAEPIYNGVVSTNLSVLDTDTGETVTIAEDTLVYVFYSYIKNKDGKYVQFIKKVDNDLYVIDSNNVITATNYRIVADDLTVIDTETGIKIKSGDTTLISISDIETRFQANRLAYNQLTTYDPIMERTVDRFKVKNGDLEIYKYDDYSYTTSNVVMNYVVNGENFNILEDGSLQGWNPYTDQSGEATVKKLELVTKPEIGTGKLLAELNQLSEIQGFLKVQFNGAGTTSNNRFLNTLYNSGIENNASFIESISKGDKFVFRWRAGVGSINNLSPTQNLRAFIAKYTQDPPTRYGFYYKHINPNDIIVHFGNLTQPNNVTITELNNIITGGIIVDNPDDTQSYDIDGVPQTPSTKYIYVYNNQQYVWNGVENCFKPKTDANYLPYYYIVGTASKSVSKSVMTDTATKIGLFIYHVGSPQTYFLQDVQVTRFIPDGSDNTGNTPILIGNVPTAESNLTSYYYVKPKENAIAEDIVTYKSLTELIAGEGMPGGTEIQPLYNQNSEKVLSISASQSNCFDILQTIAETFECWIDLLVKHDERGYITSTNGKKDKFVCLKDYIRKEDNWAGFRYGINLESIQRTINSDEIVTKLIVDQSQSDYVDEGFISIASAPSNQSGESYILNFDYFYNQNLLDRDKAEADKLKFIEDVKDINQVLKTYNKRKADYETSLAEIGSKRNVYTELVDTALDNRNDALGRFERLTGRTYANYQDKQKRAVLYLNRYYIKTDDTKFLANKPYYSYSSNVMTEITNRTGNPKTRDCYELLIDLSEEETVLGIIAEIYVCSATINNYGGLLTNINKEYFEVRKNLYGSENFKIKIWTDIDYNNQRHVYFELNDYLTGFSFNFGGSTYTCTVSQKYFDITNANAVRVTFSPPTGYSVDSDPYDIVDGKIETIKITSNNSFDGIEDLIEEKLEKKTELVSNFNNKYGRFIQEGTWNSTDYIDSERYYLDALQVSNTSAQPEVTYTINVIEVSQLEGLELYTFDVGDKSFVEDTEFFGWTNINGNLTPAREEVIVSEIEWHLEEPNENTITVQNYKTRFEDLFQRISATVQTVQYNEATYAKMSTLLDANGTINQGVLLDSLNRIKGKNYTLTSDGSVVVNGDQILVQNLTNPANCVILNSEGLRVSSDGGATWRTAIDGEGINAGTVYTGTLNTQNIIIGNSDNPSFRWDKTGISAYKKNSDETYDLNTYVRYDQYGLYGIQNNVFNAESIDDIKEKAHFGITWDGFFIKNTYPGGGRVEITSENDFRVMNIPSGETEEQEKIKIGALEWGRNGEIPIISPDEEGATEEPTLYGIRIRNDAGDEVFKTGDDGNLEITGDIKATGGNFVDRIYVGKDETDNTKPYIIIDGRNVNNSPLIASSNYEDGATYGWMINKDGDAYFNNITARGAIKTAVFEYAEIQAVGGVFLFRPSSTIESVEVVEEYGYVKTEDTTCDNEKTYYIYDTSSGEYTEVDTPDDEDIESYYEQDGILHGNLKFTVKTSHLFKLNDWVKISNYTGDGQDPDADSTLSNNGLVHVYRVSSVYNNMVVLEDASAMVEGQTGVVDIQELPGGALVSMGNYENGINSNNYGIGVNSSDNTVNLPRRSISLFETSINPSGNPKVTYNYRGILGTLPILSEMGGLVEDTTYSKLSGTQGIYTDNMYIGDREQFIAFYRENNSQESTDQTKQLKIKTNNFNLESQSPYISLGNENNFHIYINADPSEMIMYPPNSATAVPVYSKRYGVGFFEGSHIKELIPTSGNFQPTVDIYYDRVTEEIVTNPNEEDFYDNEYLVEKDKRIAYINGQKLSIPYTVVLKGMQLGNKWIWELNPDTDNLTLKWTGGE